MCEPISMSVAMAAAAGMQQVGGFMQQRDAHRFAKYKHELNKVAAARAARDQYTDLISQQRQVQQRASQESSEALRDARLAASATASEAASAGVAGGSMQDIATTFSARYAESTGFRYQNMRASQQQMMREMDQVRAQQEGRILSTMPGAAPRFNWLGAIGSVTGAAAGGAAQGKMMQRG